MNIIEWGNNALFEEGQFRVGALLSGEWFALIVAVTFGAYFLHGILFTQLSRAHVDFATFGLHSRKYSSPSVIVASLLAVSLTSAVAQVTKGTQPYFAGSAPRSWPAQRYNL